MNILQAKAFDVYITAIRPQFQLYKTGSDLYQQKTDANFYRSNQSHMAMLEA